MLSCNSLTSTPHYILPKPLLLSHQTTVETIDSGDSGEIGMDSLAIAIINPLIGHVFMLGYTDRRYPCNYLEFMVP